MGFRGAASLGELTDVDITGATDGEALVFDTAQGKWIDADAGRLSVDPARFAQIGAAGVMERWYPLGFNPYDGAQTIALAPNVLRAYPVVLQRSGTIDLASINVTTLAVGGAFQVGLYGTNDDDDLYPGALLKSFGEFLGTTGGIKSNAVNPVFALTAGRLYWIAFVAAVAANNLRHYSSSLRMPWGVDTLMSPGTVPNVAGWTVAHAYAALPANYPAGGAHVTGTSQIPAAAVRWAS